MAHYRARVRFPLRQRQRRFVNPVARRSRPSPKRPPTVVAADFAAETDAAQAITAVKSRLIGFASETDTARSLPKIVAVSLASETDTAIPLAKRVNAGFAVETDTAQAITAVKSKAITHNAAWVFDWTIADAATMTGTSGNWSRALTMPGHEAGDLLIVAAYLKGSAFFFPPLAAGVGWSTLARGYDETPDVAFFVFGMIADGTETVTLSSSLSSAPTVAALVLTVRDHNFTSISEVQSRITNPFEPGSNISTSSATGENISVPELDTGVSDRYTWFEFLGSESAPPWPGNGGTEVDFWSTGFTPLARTAAGGDPGAWVSAAYRATTAASEDPDSMSQTTTNRDAWATIHAVPFDFNPTETDTAQTILVRPFKIPVGLASETDTAQTVNRSLNNSTETDTAQAITALKTMAIAPMHPYVASATSGTELAADPHTVPYPSNIQVGDRVILVFAKVPSVSQSLAASDGDGLLTDLNGATFGPSGTVRYKAFARTYTSTSGASISVDFEGTTINSECAWVMISVRGYGDSTGLLDVFLLDSFSGTNDPNSSQIAPAGTTPRLFVNAYATRNRAFVSQPAGYTLQAQITGPSNNVGVGIATKLSSTTPEDPGAWDLSGTGDGHAMLGHFHPPSLVETDTAQTVTINPRRRLVNFPTETDTAQTIIMREHIDDLAGVADHERVELTWTEPQDSCTITDYVVQRRLVRT